MAAQVVVQLRGFDAARHALQARARVRPEPDAVLDRHEVQVEGSKRVSSARNWRCELLDAQRTATCFDKIKDDGPLKPQVFHADQLKKDDPKALPFA